MTTLVTSNPAPVAQLHYTYHFNPRVAVAVARYLGAPVTYIRSHPRDPQFEPAFRAINPNALCPILVEPQRTIWETDAVACRLSDMVGSDFWRAGEQLPEMIMWLSWSAHHLNRAGGDLYFHRISRPTFSDEKCDPAVLDEALREFTEYAAILDAQLAHRTWLVGNRISYADFRVATALPFADAAGLPLNQFKHVKRWHDQLLEIDAWRAPFEGLSE
ncbi:MAG: glutathione S-transferase family protein [Pseudomonadota bacterium]